MARRESVARISPIVIRKSATLFVIRIILLELLFEIIYLSWRSLIHFLPFSLEIIVTLNFISIIAFLILVTILQNILLVFISLGWLNDYYEIRSDEIAHITGTLSKTEKAYPYRDIQSITIHQDFLGRVFHYGSVHLYIPALGHELHFTEIPNPANFVEVIKGMNPRLESERYLFRR